MGGRTYSAGEWGDCSQFWRVKILLQHYGAGSDKLALGAHVLLSAQPTNSEALSGVPS